MAEALIDGLTGDFDPDQYRDEYRDRVVSLIERKAAGQPLTEAPVESEPKGAPAPDLMAALEASLAAVQSSSKVTSKPQRKPAAKSKAAAAKSEAEADGKPVRTRSTSKSKSK